MFLLGGNVDKHQGLAVAPENDGYEGGEDGLVTGDVPHGAGV